MRKVMANTDLVITKLSDGREKQYIELSCGNCYSVLYGYDEEICPCCGAFNE